MGSMMGGVGYGSGMWSLIAVVLVIALLTGTGALLTGRTRRGGSGSERVEEDTPQAILRRRYAAGEIDEDEYLRRLAGLSQR